MAMMPWRSAATETESEAAANQLQVDSTTSDHDLLSALAESGNPHAEKVGYTSEDIAAFLERNREAFEIAHKLRQRLNG